MSIATKQKRDATNIKMVRQKLNGDVFGGSRFIDQINY